MIVCVWGGGGRRREKNGWQGEWSPTRSVMSAAWPEEAVEGREEEAGCWETCVVVGSQLDGAAGRGAA